VSVADCTAGTMAWMPRAVGEYIHQLKNIAAITDPDISCEMNRVYSLVSPCAVVSFGGFHWKSGVESEAAKTDSADVSRSSSRE